MSAQLTPNDIHRLTEITKNVRSNIIKMLYHAGSGHSAGSLSWAEIMVFIYFYLAKHQPQNPQWPDRDYVLLSSGHHCPALYAVLAEAGYFPIEELVQLRKLGSRLQGHPQRQLVPGVEISAGSLAQGISQAVGLAIGLKADHKPNHVFCLMSDGEFQEGQTWEALLLANKYHLGNLSIIVDVNKIQISGHTDQVMPMHPFFEKIADFGWNAIKTNGHNFIELNKAFTQDLSNDNPSVILCQTIAGKGVSFMENNPEWHGKAPNKEETIKALTEINES
ncbi:MAG: transketolase [Candidatus Pacebacteria bacterium CG10_big_fil_rev_8_21_14_0_10_36_11]|nr:transketolase [Candidatus Pacearchaeota archaeon]OIP74521.1 MAG: transketolase [Candidatus Pacebacteria bacterium CG2_30_36_39]PIR65147.1 MAG: transketolase [Candidatus Pacebacteria bacterium CG10_big_fil_rev_8_21_14_0_10_36_11]PJC42638.1 MAG: transketolase [Candidatus Pacebacteria bacterium CG_4_9_14_0_2_um_filter_36_8]